MIFKRELQVVVVVVDVWFVSICGMLAGVFHFSLAIGKKHGYTIQSRRWMLASILHYVEKR